MTVSVDSPRRARLLGGATALVGGLMLLTALALLLWALGLSTALAGRSDHFGLSGLASIVVLGIAVPSTATVGTLGAVYLVVGLREFSSHVVTWASTLAGAASFCLAAVIVAVMTSLQWDDAATAPWHTLAAVWVALLGTHGALVFACSRPATPRCAAAWAIAGAAFVLAGVGLIGRVVPLAPIDTEFEASDGAPLLMSGYRRRVDALTVSPDGARLAVTVRRRVTMFDVPADRVLWSTPLGGYSYDSAPSLVLAPDGSQLLFSDDRTFAVLDARSGAITLQPTCGPPPNDDWRTVSGTFARAGSSLALAVKAKDGGAVCFLDAASGAVVSTSARACTQLTATARGERVWATCGDTIVAWDPTTGAELTTIVAPAFLFGVFPDDTRLLIVNDGAAGGSIVQVRDTGTGTVRHDFALESRPYTLVGPIGDGAAWLLDGEDGLFAVDLDARAVTRRICDSADRTSVAGTHLAIASDSCLPRGVRIEVRDLGE